MKGIIDGFCHIRPLFCTLSAMLKACPKDGGQAQDHASRASCF